MGNVIKMELYRLSRSASFYVNLLLVFVLSFAIAPVGQLMKKLLLAIGSSEAAGTVSVTTTNFWSLVSVPLYYSLLLVFIMISMIHFAYADLANGYIKNIAGQLPKKGYTVIAKFVVIGIANFCFLLAGLLGQTIGECIVHKLVFASDRIGSSIATFFVRWLLLQAILSIVLFITAGLHAKTLATVFGVIVSTGVLATGYFGLDFAIGKLINVSSDFSVANYAPDRMLTAEQFTISNALIVSVVIICIFVPLTVTAFNKHDVK